MTVTRETPEVAVPTAEQVETDTRKKLEEAKSKIDPKAGAMELIQRFLKDYKTLSHEEKTKRIFSILFTITLGNLLGIKQKPEEVLGVEPKAQEAKTETPATVPASATDESKEPATANEPEKAKPGSSGGSGSALPKIDLEKYRKGDLIAAVIGLYPGVEVKGKSEPLQTSISSNKGVPKWTKKSTDDWDFGKAGNTDEEIEKGNYKVQSTMAPNGYTRGGTDQVPSATQKKLIKIAELLRADSRMPLFTGIAMTVDGVEVMMVKEIHIHSMSEYGKRNLSDYYYQPHTGVSYIMKKTS